MLTHRINKNACATNHESPTTNHFAGAHGAPYWLVGGAGLRIRAAVADRFLTLASSALELVAIPAAAALLCLAAAVDGPRAVVAVLFAALPSSGSSYVLASQMGADATLMAGILSVQTLLAFLMLPLLLVLMV